MRLRDKRDMPTKLDLVWGLRFEELLDPGSKCQNCFFLLALLRFFFDGV